MNRSQQEIEKPITDSKPEDATDRSHKHSSGEALMLDEGTSEDKNSPFMLETPSEQLSKVTYQNIDILEDPGSDTSFSSKHPHLRFESNLDPILEFPPNSLAQNRLLSKAYSLFTSLLIHHSSMSWSSSQGELRFEDYLDMVKGALERVERLSKSLSPERNRETILQGAKLIFEQLEQCVTAYSKAESREIALKSENLALLKRCEMAETRANLMFDKLKATEVEEMQVEMGEIEESTGIQAEITRKEAQISVLQQEMRRLTSRKVLQELSEAKDASAIAVRSMRKGRCSSAHNSRSKAISPDRPSSRVPISMPLLCQNCKGSLIPSRPSPTRNHLQDLQSELELSLKHLVAEKSKVRELEANILEMKTARDTTEGSTRQESMIQEGRRALVVERVGGREIRSEKREGVKTDRAYCCPAF